MRGCSAMVFDEPAQVRFVADRIASSGDPMGATTMGPVTVPVRLPKICASFGAVKVTTAFARKAPSTEKARESASQPDGRSTATTGAGSAIDAIAQRRGYTTQRRLESRADDCVEKQIG